MTETVLSVFGTRPEAIKMAPLVRELEADDGIESLVCSTGQHREMLETLVDLFEIEVDHDLDVMEEDQTPTGVVAAILDSLEPILEKEDPDWVLVQGDTSTVAASSLAAFYSGVRVGHVEAGLRTRDKWNPFPEEINRRVAGVVADRHFAPTPSARENLEREDVPGEGIHVVGNTVIDALEWVADRPAPSKVDQILDGRDRTILVTAHRRENHGEPLERICSALRALAEDLGDETQIVYSVHLNPNVWDPVHEALGDVDNITLVPPLDYPVLVHLMKAAYLVLTDSGGIQEEAPALGKPVLVLREKTERPEGVEAGTVRLVGTDEDQILREVGRLLRDEEAYAAMSNAVNPYGDGHASQRILQLLLGKTPDEFEPA